MVTESIHFCGGWLSEVKYRKEEECDGSVSRNGESESVLSGSHNGKCVDSVSENVKEDECWKIRVLIDNPCRAVGSKNTGQNWSCGCSCEH